MLDESANYTEASLWEKKLKKNEEDVFKISTVLGWNRNMNYP